MYKTKPNLAWSYTFMKVYINKATKQTRAIIYNVKVKRQCFYERTNTFQDAVNSCEYRLNSTLKGRVDETNTHRDRVEWSNRKV